MKTTILPLVIQAHNVFQQSTHKNLHYPESALEMKPYLLLEQNITYIRRKL